MACTAIYSGAAVAMAAASSGAPLPLGQDAAARQEVTTRLVQAQPLPKALAALQPPNLGDKPQWYQAQVAAERQATEQQEASAAPQARRPRQRPQQPPGQPGRVVTYTISTRGRVASNQAEFAAQVNQTLNDQRGWARLGIAFRQVPQGGQFNLILSEAALLPQFSSGCSSEWSCRVGPSVIINDYRWQGSTPAWQAAGGGLRDYRHMVINHEVGHWLGHGHIPCGGPGAAAPVMLQQSISLQGCRFNPWPLEGELWSSTLGINR